MLCYSYNYYHNNFWLWEFYFQSTLLGCSVELLRFIQILKDCWHLAVVLTLSPTVPDKPPERERVQAGGRADKLTDEFQLEQATAATHFPSASI